ncbi:MAG: hypothetical protein RQ952_02270 [Thermoproteota archaeon]|jgi:ssDNA-binding Zn-finger/Zn-ribbon topoisomerase 1|nr:hypothetical protein [Thermoproteota archaeon]
MSLREIAETFKEIANMKPLSLLKCPVCGESVERSYKEGEYVTKTVEDKCPKCSNPMYVKLIYVNIPPQQPS